MTPSSPPCASFFHSSGLIGEYREFHREIEVLKHYIKIHREIEALKHHWAPLFLYGSLYGFWISMDLSILLVFERLYLSIDLSIPLVFERLPLSLHGSLYFPSPAALLPTAEKSLSFLQTLFLQTLFLPSYGFERLYLSIPLVFERLFYLSMHVSIPQSVKNLQFTSHHKPFDRPWDRSYSREIHLSLSLSLSLSLCIHKL